MKWKLPNGWSDQLAAARQAKASLEEDWTTELEYVASEQFEDLDKEAGLLAPRDDIKRGMLVFNRLQSNVNQAHARLLVTLPAVAALPASDSNDDITKAQLASELARYYWTTALIEETFNEEAFPFLVPIGTVAQHTYYDPADDEVKTDIVSPFDLIVPKGIRKFSEAWWVAVRTLVAKGDLLDCYDKDPEARKAIKAANPVTGDDEPEDHLEMLDVYWRSGQHAIILGGDNGKEVVLWSGEFDRDAFPVQVARSNVIGKRFWGFGMVHFAMDPQNAYNRAWNQILDGTDLMADPVILEPDECALDADAFTQGAGERVRYKASSGFKPSVMDGVALPHAVYLNLQRLQEEIDDACGIHPGSKGDTATGVKSAIHAKTLQSGDQMGLARVEASIAAMLRGTLKAALSLMKRHYTRPRMAQMMDDTGEWAWKTLQATNMGPVPEISFDTSTLFRSHIEDRRREVMELAAAQLLDPQDAREALAFRVSNRSDLAKIKARRHAQEMLELAKHGYEIEFFKSDDIGAFDDVFYEFMRDLVFYELPQELQDHIAATYQQIVAIKNAGIQAVMSKQQAVPGGSTGVPPPAPSNPIANAMPEPVPDGGPMMPAAGMPMEAGVM